DRRGALHMTTDIETLAPDTAPHTGPADPEAERILAATVMAQPRLVDDLAAEGFDPADISDERLRMIWYAVEDLAPHLTSGDIRWEAVARKLDAWHAEGRMATRPLTALQLAELYNQAMPGAAGYWADRVARIAVAARAAALGTTMRLKATSPAFDPDTDVPAFQAEIDHLVRPTSVSQAATIGELLPAALERAITPPKQEHRIPTGIVDLDALLSGGW